MEGWSRGLRQLFAKQSGIDFASQVRILYFPPIGPIKSIGRWLISSITSGCDKRLVVQIHLGPPRDITLFKIYLHSYYNICCSLNLLKINKLVRMRNFIGMEFLLHTFVLFCHEKYTSFLDKQLSWLERQAVNLCVEGSSPSLSSSTYCGVQQRQLISLIS